jgi:hypothetical protein
LIGCRDPKASTCPASSSEGALLFSIHSSPVSVLTLAVLGRPDGVPQPLFPTQIGFGNNRPYAVDRSGERFLVPIAADPRVVAVMDWRALLPR